MAHIGKEVVALIPGSLGYIHGQAQCHSTVPYVATTLVHLSYMSVGTSFQIALDVCHDQIPEEFRQSVVLYGSLSRVASVACHIMHDGRFGEVAYLVILEE